MVGYQSSESSVDWVFSFGASTKILSPSAPLVSIQLVSSARVT